jgi:hypothetical protein
MKLSTFTTVWLLPCSYAATALITGWMLPQKAMAYTTVFTFTGKGNVGSPGYGFVNSWSVASDGPDPTTLTVSGLNGGGFRAVNGFGLCAYWSKNSNNNNTCDNSAGTSYNGLAFTVSANQQLYNLKLTSIVIGDARFGSYTTGGATDTIISTFSGAAGSSATYSQIPASGAYTFNNTPIMADSNNSILLCSTPNINGQACTGNIVNGSNGIFNTSFYTISSMTFTYDTPAPLPLLGTGAAFGWSRRLRRRIKRHRFDHSD